MSDIFNGIPRDPARIPMIMAEIQRIWLQHPDLRLGQLLLNLGDESRMYYIEDLPLVQTLQAFYERDTMNEKPS